MPKVPRKEKPIAAQKKKSLVPEQAIKAKKERGVTLKGAKPEAVMKAIEDFLTAHEGVFIHPKQDMVRLVEQMISLGYCPCLRTALSCPHPNVETQIRAEGKCICGLFVTEDYLKQFYVKKGNEWLPVSAKPPASVGKAYYWSPEKGWYKVEKSEGGKAESRT